MPHVESTERREPKRERKTSRVVRWLYPKGLETGTHPDEFDADAVESAIRWIGLLFGPRRYFRVEAKGWPHLPPSPVMVVSNHSGGSLFLDTWGLGWAWYQHFGVRRPIHPAAHDMLLANPIVGPFMARRGVVRADRRLAHEVLEDWREDLLVMPGGDLDVWRPYRKRFEVQFAGRTGYARIALQAGVPIIPVAHAGAHETLMVLTDGKRLAEALHLPEIARAHIWPIHLSFPWLLGFGPLPHFPIPSRLRYLFGAPIFPSEVGHVPGRAPTDEEIRALDAKVRANVQSQLDTLRRGG